MSLGEGPRGRRFAERRPRRPLDPARARGHCLVERALGARRAHRAQGARRGEAQARGAAGRPPFAALQDRAQDRHRGFAAADAPERLDRLQVQAFHCARVSGMREDVDEERRRPFIPQRPERLDDGFPRVTGAGLQGVFQEVEGVVRADLDDGAQGLALHLRIGVVEHGAQVGQGLVAAERAEQVHGRAPDGGVRRPAQFVRVGARRRAKTDQHVAQPSHRAGVVLGGERVGQRLHQGRPDHLAQLGGERHVRIGRPAQPHREVPHHGSGRQPRDGGGGRRGKRGLLLARRGDDRLQQLERERQLADQHQLFDRGDAAVDDAGPHVEARLDLEQIEDQALVEGLHRVAAHGGQPRPNARRRDVADAVHLDGLGPRLRQLARVVGGHVVLVRVRGEQVHRIRPHALELWVLAEGGALRLAPGRGQHVELVGGARHEGVERRRQAARRAVVPDDVVGDEPADRFVRQPRLEFGAEVHPRLVRIHRRERWRVRDEREQQLRRQLHRRPRPSAAAWRRGCRATAGRHSWRARASCARATDARRRRPGRPRGCAPATAR